VGFCLLFQKAARWFSFLVLFSLTSNSKEKSTPLFRQVINYPTCRAVSFAAFL
jgi:hypothetical protein